MRSPKYEVRISVDGIYLTPNEVVFFLQNDPFPGNHTYKLRFCGIQTKAYFKTLSLGEYVFPEREICREVAFSLNNRLERIAHWQNFSDPAKFLLNTIDQLILDEDEIYLEGTCSEVKKRSD